VWPRWSRDEDTRSVQIGVVATLLVHLLLLLALPYLLRRTADAVAVKPADKTFNIELAPEEPEVPLTQAQPPAKPFNFVEVNPDAPDNPPDQTENFGAQNQQVAQEKPTPDGKSDTPALDGDKQRQSTAIVSGRLQPPEPPSRLAQPEPAPTPQEAVTAPDQKVAQAPIPGFERVEGEDADSIGSTIAKIPPPGTKRGPEEVDGSPEVREVVAFNGQVVRIDPRRPQDRERVAQRNARPAFLRDNQLGTQNIGPVAYNAKWSEYGAYLQKLIETVQIQWERLIVQSSVYPPPGTIVRVTFIINDQGDITDIAPGDGEAPLQAKRACVSAITARAPYGKWSDDMVAVLGREQEMTFTFYYNP
jgi:hypothetical protein